MNPIYKLRHKIQMLKDFLQLLSTGPVTEGGSSSERRLKWWGGTKILQGLIRPWFFVQFFDTMLPNS